MIDQSYHAKALLRLTSRLDPKKYKLGRNRKEYLATFEKINEELIKDDFEFSQFTKSSRGRKPVYTPSTCKDEFALRKLNDNLARVYDVRQANRSEIIEQVICLMREIIPFFVIKLDIKSFYESIYRQELIASIKEDISLSYRSRQHLHLLLGTRKYFTQRGLPRGLGVSATLAELYMKSFDVKVRNLPGIYFYSRYVDDIIIFCYKTPDDIIGAATKALPPGLAFNHDKTAQFEFDKKGNCVSKHGVREFNYLGYNFNFDRVAIKNSSSVKVRIAPNKIDKLKNRIMLSIFRYLSDGNYLLLKDRLRFLSGNCQMKSDRDNGKLLSGIYYNYHLIDDGSVDDLKQLSTFLANAVYSKKGSFGIRLNARLSPTQKRELTKYCFKTGFTERIMCNFSPNRLKEIKQCWAYV
ncbi:UNVERIFIED_ORG: reverse transcriptase (RNA-dependent DNA polymerase) [Zoogloea ramigera]|uniref:Antiviral reverse transcriptase Drt3a n=1 Tax=Duganella zoogloeoides TaxID=75659 RepID=A0ABZ0Y1P1_9BURK|nr:antiviral reverse transcriptase Drt3a [Duganella zoogloeoides]WQH05336.1 antiviral reverse transcriptase Drt3a [Duganella zoogloeoides]